MSEAVLLGLSDLHLWLRPASVEIEPVPTLCPVLAGNGLVRSVIQRHGPFVRRTPRHEDETSGRGVHGEWPFHGLLRVMFDQSRLALPVRLAQSLHSTPCAGHLMIVQMLPATW